MTKLSSSPDGSPPGSDLDADLAKIRERATWNATNFGLTPTLLAGRDTLAVLVLLDAAREKIEQRDRLLGRLAELTELLRIGRVTAARAVEYANLAVGIAHEYEDLLEEKR